MLLAGRQNHSYGHCLLIRTEMSTILKKPSIYFPLKASLRNQRRIAAVNKEYLRNNMARDKKASRFIAEYITGAVVINLHRDEQSHALRGIKNLHAETKELVSYVHVFPMQKKL